jgi:hypothetical protein
VTGVFGCDLVLHRVLLLADPLARVFVTQVAPRCNHKRRQPRRTGISFKVKSNL